MHLHENKPCLRKAEDQTIGYNKKQIEGQDEIETYANFS